MMRKRLTMVALLALALLLVPVRAYADFSLDPFGNGNIWTGRVNDSNFGAFTRANDIYDAAVYAIGQDPITLSSEVRSKLSDPNHGGHFYEFAQSFVNLEGSYDLPEWLPIYMLVLVPNYPDWPRYWKAEVAYSLRTNAETDFKRVLAGEDLGGSGGNVSGFTPFTLNSGRLQYSFSISSSQYPSYQTNFKNAVVSSDGIVTLTGGTGRFSDVVGVPGYVSSIRLYVSPSVRSFIQSVGKEFLFFAICRGSSETVDVGFIYGDNLSVSRHVHPNNSSITRDFIHGTDMHAWLTRGLTAYHDSDGVFLVMPDVVPSGVYSISSPTDSSFFSSFITPPAAPDGDWPEPETPVTPTAPEQPTPTAPTVTPDPTITEPTPTWPDVTININPDPTVSVTPTGLDYTELLTRINDNLNTINSYSVSINSNLNSLRSDLVTEFESVEQGLKNIYQYLQHFDNLLERHCKHLRDALDDGIYNLELYLKRLFEWLPQQLNFDANFDYDDSSIQTLLRRILTKIPGTNSGLPNDTMPNPVADEPGFFDWLSDLWHRFLIDLVSVLPDELGGLVDAFSQLTHYFPFSIPWDLAALLALFEHEPVTPVFDVPWGFGGGDGDVEMVHIDLSPWDGVMQMVRPVFVVGFCWQLAMITKDLLSGFDINKGGV